MKKEKRKIGSKKIFIIVLIIIIVLLAGAIGTFAALRHFGASSMDNKDASLMTPEDVVSEDAGKSIIYNGQKYCYNENTISILCMGVDKESNSDGEAVAGNNGQADSLFLAVMDKEKGGVQVIGISRDSMTDIDIYNTENQFTKTENAQLCLAYAYGGSEKESCENVSKAVSRLLYGIPVNAYAAIDLSAVSVLNDAVGGVEVQVLGDLSSKDAALTPGSIVTLQGDQAETYVRYRDVTQLDSNNPRMARQRQYIHAFAKKALEATKTDLATPLNLYSLLGSDLTTDIDPAKVTYLTSLVLKNGMSDIDIQSISGEVQMGAEYAEFHPDETALYELILDVFYNKVTS